MISTRGRYALRVMVDLAEHEGAGPVPVREIAERQQISDKYLEQIIGALSRAHLVKSLRGASGGYRLGVPATGITVGMILRATEGDLAPIACMQEGATPCARSASCVSQKLFRRVYDAINSVIDQVSLTELVEEDRKGEEPPL